MTEPLSNGETIVNYEQAKGHIFAAGSVPGGYFGDRAQVDFSLEPETGKILIIHSCGFYTAPIPPASSVSEAIWLLVNHPNARDYRIE